MKTSKLFEAIAHSGGSNKNLLTAAEKYFGGIFLLAFFLSPVLTAQEITKGPWLAKPAPRSITIRWETDIRGDYTLTYGTRKPAGKSLPAVLLGQHHGKWLYEATPERLTPGKEYFYSIRSRDHALAQATFRTTPAGAPLLFAVMGDSRSKPEVFSSVIRLINRAGPAVVVANGDLVAKGGNEWQWQDQFFTPAAALLDHVPFLSAVGDHESDPVDGDHAALFTGYLYPGRDSLHLWFSRDVGEAHFVFLDWRYPYDSAMVRWFEKDMKNTSQPWKFVVMHRPPYNLGGHHSSWGKKLWPRLFEKYHVDVVFSGHSHLYERFRPAVAPDGSWAVTYITTGGAGAPLYEATKAPALAFTQSVNHFLLVTLDGERIRIRTLGLRGELLDSVSWTKDHGTISSSYMSSAFPRRELDIINVFNTPLSARMDRLPMAEVPYAPVLDLDATLIPEDIEYTIRLADESEGKYTMSPVTGTLPAERQRHVQLKIYGRSTLTVTRWGDLTPPLRLIVEYRTPRYHGTVRGARLEYIAW